jgi:hypothetical protein
MQTIWIDGRAFERTTPNRCVDCRRTISEGPRCVSCANYFEDAVPEDACEDCGKVLLGTELAWAISCASPICQDCAAQ